MIVQNNFKQALEERKLQYGLWMSSTSSYIAEIAATSHYDWCLIDGEHAPNTIQDIYYQLQAIAPYDIHPVVRLVEGKASHIKQVLDIGCQNLLIPMVETAEQAREIVRATRYPPVGVRGVGASVARASRWGRIANYIDLAEQDTCLIIQIESKLGVDNLDEILSVEGIDGIFIGPADLSASLGYPDQSEHPNVEAVINDCIRKISQASKPIGFLTLNPVLAKKVIELGVSFIAIGIDVLLYRQALDERIRLFKPIA